MECYDVDEQDDWGFQTQIDLEPITNYSQLEDQSENEEVTEDSQAKRRKRSNSSGPSDNFSQGQQTFLNDVTPVPVVPSSASVPIASRTEDTYDVFGKYIASLLRNLPAQKALRLQPKIVDMIVTVSVMEEETKANETQTE